MASPHYLAEAQPPKQTIHIMKKILLLFAVLIVLAASAGAQGRKEGKRAPLVVIGDSVNRARDFYAGGEFVPCVVTVDSVTGEQRYEGGEWHRWSTFKVLEIERVTYTYRPDTVLLVQVMCIDTALYESGTKMTIVSFPSKEPCAGTVLEEGNTYELHVWLWHGLLAVGCVSGEQPAFDYINGVGVPVEKLRSQPLRVKELHGLCLERESSDG